MKDMNDIVNQLVEDMETIPEDVPVTYEVWAIGYDEDCDLTGAEMRLGTFDDPDQAVHFAKNTTLADVVNLAVDDEYDVTVAAYSISIEVETVVPDDEGNMNIGTIYKKTLEIYEELPEYVVLMVDDYTILNGDVVVPKKLIPDYNLGETFTAVFIDNHSVSQPITYKIKSETDDYFVCDFV